VHSGHYLLDPNQKEWDFALLFVRAFRSLDSIVGDEASARTSLRSENRGLGARPFELIQELEGLVRDSGRERPNRSFR